MKLHWMKRLDRVFMQRAQEERKIRWDKLGVMFFLLFLLSFGLSACGERAGNMGDVAEHDKGSGGGHPSEPSRIVSLLPSNTELLAALSATDRLVGVTANDTYPPEVVQLPKVGDMTINGEAVLLLKPDLVLASPYHEDVVALLRRSGVPVLLIPEAQSLTDIVTALREVGQAIGAEDKAHRVEAHLTALLKRYPLQQAESSRAPRVWLEIAPPPELYTAGGNTFLGEALSRAGGRNIARDQSGWPLWSMEDVLANNPDIIFLLHHGEGDHAASTEAQGLSDGPVHRASPETMKRLAQRPGWSELKALQNDDVYVLDEDIFSRPAPRLIEALPPLAEVIEAVQNDAVKERP